MNYTSKKIYPFGLQIRKLPMGWDGERAIGVLVMARNLWPEDPRKIVLVQVSFWFVAAWFSFPSNFPSKTSKI